MRRWRLNLRAKKDKTCDGKFPGNYDDKSTSTTPSVYCSREDFIIQPPLLYSSLHQLAILNLHHLSNTVSQLADSSFGQESWSIDRTYENRERSLQRARNYTSDMRLGDRRSKQLPDSRLYTLDQTSNLALYPPSHILDLKLATLHSRQFSYIRPLLGSKAIFFPHSEVEPG